MKDAFFAFTNNSIKQPTHYIVPLPSAIFQATTQFHLLKTFYLLGQRTNCSRCLLPPSRGLNSFPLREFCKDRKRWESEGAVSGDRGGGVRRPSQAVTVVPRPQRHTRSWVVLADSVRSLWADSGHFSPSAASSWSDREQGLLDCLSFWKELLYRTPSQPHHILNITSRDEDRPLRGWGAAFHSPHNLFCSALS